MIYPHFLRRRLQVGPPILLLLLCGSALAHEPHDTMPVPGYRPDSAYAQEFVDSAGSMTVTVLPTLVRRMERTGHSLSSQRAIVDFLNAGGIASASAKSKRLDLGRLLHASQWELFEYGSRTLAKTLADYETGSDYTFVMEILLPEGNAVFGIEIYILDSEGRNAFSFLLNDHHEVFAEGHLIAPDSSQAAREQMMMDATMVGLRALQMQLEDATECARASAVPPAKSTEGVLHDFESALVSGTDKFGVETGFSTFSGPNSAVSIGVTDGPPRRTGAEAGGALRIAIDSSDWAGVIQRFAADDAEWQPLDWSDLDGFSFRLYGNNSGTEMYFDILDNRRPCSRVDDAERFRYQFIDDVAGWRKIQVSFNDLMRWEIYNNALNDGLSLTHVHGWGLGTTNTDDETVFYVDDFELMADATEPVSPSTVVSHRLFVETRLDESSSRILIDTSRDGRFVSAQILDLMCEIAALTSDRGFQYFRIDERAKLSGHRATSRLTFFEERPKDVPVQDVQNPEVTSGAAASRAWALNAADVLEGCKLAEGLQQD